MKNNTAPATLEMQALGRIEKKLDGLDGRMDGMERRASVAGTVSGSLAGGIVASAIYLIKAKMGW